MNQQTLIYIAIGWFFLMGPGSAIFKKADQTPTPPPQSSGQPQSSTITGAGAANVGGCPSNLTQDQCSKYLTERINLERDKAWAGVAGQGIAAGSGLLKSLFS